MRAFSFGGGVQSMAALVLQAQRRINYDVFLFSNVGDDSENPDTLEYYRDHVLPYAETNGIRLIEVRRETRDSETLYQRLLRSDRSIGIPIRMKNGAPGNRACTYDFKIAVIRKWVGKGNHVIGLGFSWDELHRINSDTYKHKRFASEYPLVDLRMTRANCAKLISDVGLPVPPKSACWFCPFHKPGVWQEMRQKKPDIFRKSSELENCINDKRAALGKDNVYLTRFGVPLEQAIGDQPFLLELNDDTCETGYCMT